MSKKIALKPLANTKIRIDNQWESDIYSIPGGKLKSLSEVSIGGKNYKVTGMSVSVRYLDMGYEGYGTSKHYFVAETVFGIKKQFDLNEIVGKKPVYALKFTLETK